MVLLVYTIVYLLLMAAVDGASAPTHLLVTRVGPCDLPGAEVTISELGVSTTTYDAALSGLLNITQDVHNGWQINATMQKCQDIRNVDTCDFFKSFFVVKNGCEDDDEDEQELYGMFFHYTQPRLDCPVLKGVYKIERYPIFTGEDIVVPEAKISTSMFGYTMRLDGLSNTRKKLLCVEADIQLMYIREHNWTLVSTPHATPLQAGEGQEQYTDEPDK